MRGKGGVPLQYYLKPVSGTHCLFVVLNSCGQPIYEVTGEFSSFGRRFFLLDEERNVVGRISSVRITGSSQYSVSAGGERARVSVNVASARRPVVIRGKRWRFRGSLLLRSFDIVEEAHQAVVMTHGRYWGMAGDCYAVEVAEPEHGPLCLCLAVIIDCTVTDGRTVPAPVGG